MAQSSTENVWTNSEQHLSSLFTSNNSCHSKFIINFRRGFKIHINEAKSTMYTAIVSKSTVFNGIKKQKAKKTGTPKIN